VLINTINAWPSPECSPAQTRLDLQNSGVTGPKFIKFLPDCGMSAHRTKEGYAIHFRRSALKIDYRSKVPSAIAKRRWDRSCPLPTHMCTYPGYPEHLVKIGPVLSEIIGLQGDR